MVIVNLTRATTHKGFVRTERANDLQFSLTVKVLPSNNSKNSSLCRGYEYQVGKSVPLSCEYGDPQFWGPQVYEIVAFKHVIKLSPLSVFLGCIFSHHLCSRRQFLWCMFAIICFDPFASFGQASFMFSAFSNTCFCLSSRAWIIDSKSASG